MYRGLLITLIFIFSITLFISDVKADENPCSKNMEITELKFSVKGSANGEVTVNDIGCAVIQRNEFCAMEMLEFDSSAQAHDYYTQEPVSMQECFYVIDSGIETPMKYGIVAFKSKQGAEKFVSEQGKGKMISFEDLMHLGL
jgi:copper chaperone NosL